MAARSSSCCCRHPISARRLCWRSGSAGTSSSLQLRHGDLPVALTISLGVATLGSTCVSAEALLAAADAALYAAKHAGRNRVVCAPEAAIGETGPGVSPQPV
ncbi:diguanylate cyclase [Stutzerimonas stutzeri]|nr:diguanylate cyclase [Stutzerimonas stutzeri]MDH0728864.1 diguanylate cyclase [Stutzerimonas stutzeri]